MPTPSSTTRPIASGHDIVGAIWNATTLLSPSPAAIANGRLPPRPMITVMMAAIRAVIAASCGMVSLCPYLSTPRLRMIGFSTTM